MSKSKKSIHESFCEVYADAVVRFIVSGENEDVSFDSDKGKFTSRVVPDDIKPTHCDWWIGKDWPSFIGPLEVATDLADPKFSEETLRDAIIHALKKSATGKRMSQILADMG